MLLRRLVWTSLYAVIGAPGAGPQAPSGPQVRDGAGRGLGPSPLVVLAAALAVGILLARAIDWRSHAHPRR